MIQVFAGFDEREAIGYHTFCASVISNCSEPVSISPLSLNSLSRLYSAGQRDGTNAFIYSRFLIPYLMGYEGFAMFFDGSDMIAKGDISQLWAMRDKHKAVQVVKHDYRTKHPKKYIGTPMEADNSDYPCKNWSSVMIINCAHYSWATITPTSVETLPGSLLHRFQFVDNSRIGAIPIEWNWLCDEYGENDRANLLHWTAGIPAWEHYKNAPMADEWRKYQNLANDHA